MRARPDQPAKRDDRPRFGRVALTLLALVAGPALAPRPAIAAPSGVAVPDAAIRSLAAPPRPELESGAEVSAGRPTVKLDQLSFPSMRDASYYEKHLRRSLRQAASAADWGAGSGSVIEYRFRVDELKLVPERGVLRVSCLATGRLPGGKSASSSIEFGGRPDERRQLVRRVLDIVARGVITRLAEIEAKRRSRGSRRLRHPPSPTSPAPGAPGVDHPAATCQDEGHATTEPGGSGPDRQALRVAAGAFWLGDWRAAAGVADGRFFPRRLQ